MSRKAKTKANPLVDEILLDTPLENALAESSTLPKSGSKSIDSTPEFTILIEDGKALKLSPKMKNHVFFELGQNSEDQKLYLRMTGNEGGGLHSKLWLPLDGIIELLDSRKDNVLKSATLKPIFTSSASSNNCGFLAAVLRCKEIGLLTPTNEGVFYHRLHTDYDANKERLLNMANNA